MVGVDIEAAAGGEVAFTGQASRVRWAHESRRDPAGRPNPGQLEALSAGALTPAQESLVSAGGSPIAQDPTPTAPPAFTIETINQGAIR
jgi:hypothetical protein